ncbi:membrane protein [Gordonia phage Sapo]|nr:membrane protein [Gordonia phage Sapo]
MHLPTVQDVVPAGKVRLRVQLVYPELAGVQVGLFLAALYRGLDYATPPNEEVASLSVVEKALPFQTWGYVYLALGVLGLVGLFWVKFPLTALAHGFLVGLYFAFAVGSLWSVLTRQDADPTLLEWAWVGVLSGCALVTWAVTLVGLRKYRAVGYLVVAALVTAAVAVYASSSGVYGWRTATGWLFVLCVTHGVLANASSDEWRSLKEKRELPDSA